MSDSMPYKTPLHPLHCALNGRLIEFAGSMLPLSFAGGGIIAEHLHTRQAASLFDISHMGQIFIKKSATATLSTLVPADIETLAAGNAKYTLLTNNKGGVIDDCIITRDENGWFIVINAARKAVDIAHLNAALTAAGNEVLVEYDKQALLAVQGPAAAAIVTALFPAAANLRFMQSTCVDSPFGRCRLSRCGYTGEDGFELSVDSDAACTLAERLLQSNTCKPAGLGARDSLRLEAGLCLYGSELNEDTSPIEAGLLWTIPQTRRTSAAGYAGAATIAAQIANGAPQRLVGLLPQGKTPVRRGAELHANGTCVGKITSGVHAPTLSAPAAMALVAADVPADATLTATVRGRDILCRQTRLPFVPHRYRRAH